MALAEEETACAALHQNHCKEGRPSHSQLPCSAEDASGALSHPEDPPLSGFSPLWSDLCVLHYVLRVTGNTEYGVGVSLGTHHHQTWSSKKAQVRGKVLSTKYTTMKIRDMYIL